MPKLIAVCDYIAKKIFYDGTEEFFDSFFIHSGWIWTGKIASYGAFNSFQAVKKIFF